MRVMTVTEAHNKVVFTVSHQGKEFRAVQLVDRIGNEIYANTAVQVGDLVLVAEVPGLLLGPNMSESDASESVSLIIIGLLPPSKWHEISGYSNLVKES